MECEYVPKQDTQLQNRQALAKDVEGVTCIYAGPWQSYHDVHEHVQKLVESKIPGGCFITSMEVYESGAINCFVRNDPTDIAIGIIRYRP